MFRIISKTVVLIFFIASISFGEILPSDRRIDWNPGIPGGIPNYTVGINVKNAPYNAAGDGIKDDTKAIQDAVNACPEGYAVYLPEGTYRVTIQLAINKGIVLRGDGPERTKIMSYLTSESSIIKISASSSNTKTSISSGYTKESTSITVGSASGFSIGDYILVDQENDSSLVDKGDCTWCSRDRGDRSMGQIVKITAKEGNTLTISPGLYFTFSAALNPEIIKISNNPVEYAGIEDLYIERAIPGPGGRHAHNILIQNSACCWVKNIESYNSREDHVRLKTSFKCEIRDSYFHHGYDYGGDGGFAYGITLMNQSTDNLVENNIFYYLRHSMVLEGGGAGNVFGYNFSDRTFDKNYPDTDWLIADMMTHGSHPYMNLFEGNIGIQLHFDYTHGSGSHNTAFRNHITMESKGENKDINMHLVAVEIHKYNRYENIIGNVFGKPGLTGSYELDNITSFYIPLIWKLGYSYSSDKGTTDDPDVESTLIRHGNYDYITQSTRWDTNISDRNLPDSYYLSSKPAFFGDLPWPAIGPDLSPMVGTLPAKKRFSLTPADIK